MSDHLSIELKQYSDFQIICPLFQMRKSIVSSRLRCRDLNEGTWMSIFLVPQVRLARKNTKKTTLPSSNYQEMAYRINRIV
jgi:hypothetical protein